MAHSAVSQVSVAVPVGSDLSIRRSIFKPHTLSFCGTLWAPILTLDLSTKNARSKYRYTICMSVQQANAPKVSVSPLQLEDAKEPPLNTFKPKEPYTATIVSVERLVGPKAPGEVCHVVIDHGGNVPYWEGQSYGVIPPGENPKKPGSPHNVRLYSIASTRYGDSFDGRTASLCVRRALYYDPEKGKEDPSKSGVCSNFLCNAKPGDKVQITGPSGKIMLLPEDDPNATHIMIATGTGIAPFRGYLRRMFMESVPKYKFGGLAWLFLGVANSDSLLYDDEFSKYLRDHPDNFRYDTALSREQKNKNGGKMYVQDKIEDYSDEIFKLLDGGAHIYFCGLKGMMPGIQGTLKRVAEERGVSWEEKLSQLKKNKQWHVEVY
ncbi:ferredoxin--NADP reductase, root isozyme, chloroplastic isoform X3 [Rhodamnia argentea]|uniref:Ferredoxin--NADP reductase, chloroplastic n=1 Tax=Rhodamnia argentea TaxID=178133 RepID=A0ABM3HWU7_9MYRT|nr:ferredoxin--NADP reductase, root isozyme, chloroplastic isoform X3 [Rhodamnia argentea]